MNRKQIVVLWAFVVIILLLGLFPPWEFSHSGEPYSLGSFKSMPTIFAPPNEGDRNFRINIGYLFARWFVVAAVGTALMLHLGRAEKKRED
jgi:hypothetical protein